MYETGRLGVQFELLFFLYKNTYAEILLYVKNFIIYIRNVLKN